MALRNIISIVLLILSALPHCLASTSNINEIMKLANQGNPEAQFILSDMYRQGQAIEKDEKQAFFWIKKAAEQGYPSAEFDIASMYDAGEGIPQDFKKAAYWYTKAANKGDVAAAYNLAVMYEEGVGVQQDLSKAYAWFEVASAMGFKQSTIARQALDQSLSSNEKVIAQKEANKIIKMLKLQGVSFP